MISSIHHPWATISFSNEGNVLKNSWVKMQDFELDLQFSSDL
jgi:hypothetical protein